jgi:hypothetical protein
VFQSDGPNVSAEPQGTNLNETAMVMQTGDSFSVICLEWVDYRGEAPFAEVLQPNLMIARDALIAMTHWRRLETSLPGALPKDEFQIELQEMFALSVLNDQLICALADARLSLAEYETFWAGLGMQTFDAGAEFNPALCEVAVVTNESANAPMQTRWPGLRWGELVFSRCGISIPHNPARGIVKGIADTGILYFCNQRRGRQASDLSHGWGSNSRWRTSYHRNYLVDQYAFFNVDGRTDLVATPAKDVDRVKEDGLTIDEARELLLHRCFVQTAKGNDADFWPYDWKLSLRMDTAPSWPLRGNMLMHFDDALRVAGLLPHEARK